MCKVVCAPGFDPIGFYPSPPPSISLLFLVMKHLRTFEDRPQLGAPGACVSRVYEVWPKLFTSPSLCAVFFTRVVHVLRGLQLLQFL